MHSFQLIDSLLSLLLSLLDFVRHSRHLPLHLHNLFMHLSLSILLALDLLSQELVLLLSLNRVLSFQLILYLLLSKRFH